eukprot:464495_1
MNLLTNKNSKNYFNELAQNVQPKSLYCNQFVEDCGYCNILLRFLNNYKSEKLQYVRILAELDKQEVMKQILLPSIENIKNATEKQLLFEKLDDEKEILLDINGDKLCRMQEHEFENMLKNITNDIKIATIKSFYYLIYKECNKYISKKRTETFGDSLLNLAKIWKHVLQYHTNNYAKHIDLDDLSQTKFKLISNCEENIYKCEVTECEHCAFKLEKCYENCESMARSIERKNNRNQINIRPLNKDIALKCDDTFNEHIQRQIQNDEFYQFELDSIHNNILHEEHDHKDNYNNDEINYLMTNNDTVRLTNRDYVNIMEDDADDDDISIEMTTMKKEIQTNNVLFDIEERKEKYITEIGLYGFGLDFKYEFFGPFKANICLKDEILKSEKAAISLETWNNELTKAFGKTAIIYDDKKYTAKQYNKDYGIVRGQRMGVHHVLAISCYTDFSHLCTDYRSSFRYTQDDKNEEDIRIRHSKYYFLSRLIYISIEFFGNIMKNKQIVYHGLNQPFLFKEFSTHFNAPTSTTPSKLSAQNFAQDNGIILALRNGNIENDKNCIISQYSANQPRYLAVQWISDFAHEQEYLFYGDNIIFNISNIMHKEVPNKKGDRALKQLNLLQRIIENKKIIWDKEPKSRKNKLCQHLEETRNMNIEILNNEENDNNDQSKIDLLRKQLSETMK